MEATEPKSMDDVIEMIASQSGPAPETTEDAQSEVSDTEEVETEASDEDTTEVETDEEAEPDEADADEADEQETDEDEAADDDEDAEPELIPVKANGKEEFKTLDELKQAYAGQAKIQQDLATNAQTRKQLEAAATALMDQQNAILRMHQEVQQQGFRPQPQMPDPKLIDDNPQEYMRQRANFENEVASYQQEQAQLAQLKQRQEAYAQQQKAQHVAKGFETLKARIPELADPAKAPAYAKMMMEAGTGYEFTPEELSNIDDPRALRALNDAMKWQNLEAKRKASKAPPKPSRNVKAKAAAKAAPTEALKARQRMRKSGSVDDVAAFLLSK